MSKIDGWSYRQMVDDDAEEITLALHDRFVLLESENSILEMRYYVDSHPGLVIRDEAHQEYSCEIARWKGCEKHFWLIEAAEPGSHELHYWMPCSDYQCYNPTPNFTLHVTVKPGEWNIMTVDDTGSGSPAGAYSSLNIDRSGTPRISYYSSRTGTIMYGELEGSRWNLEPVANSSGTYSTSLALAPSGYPAISFGDGVHWGNLMYAERNGTSWDVRELDRGGSYQATDRTDSNGASVNRGSAIGDAGEYSSLAIDRFDRPHISYYDNLYGELRYAAWDPHSSQWVIRTVDTEGNVGSHTSIALDPSGHPSIAYYDEKNHALKFAQWVG